MAAGEPFGKCRAGRRSLPGQCRNTGRQGGSRRAPGAVEARPWKRGDGAFIMMAISTWKWMPGRDTMIFRTTVPGGIKVSIEHIPYVRSASVGLWVRAGSRYETDEEHGI